MKHFAIIGGGIAGCSTAHHLAKAGYLVTIYEAAPSLATGGSGNPAAMLYPRLSGNNVVSHFALDAFLYSMTLYQSLNLPTNAFKQCGLLQIAHDQNTLKRIEKAAKAFPSDCRLLSSIQASELAGTFVELPALYMEAGGWVNPKLLCEALIDHPNIKVQCNSFITAINAKNVQEQPRFYFNHLDECFDGVLLCNAHQGANFKQTEHLTLTAIKGQVSLLPPTEQSAQLSVILCSDGYLSPLIDGQHLLGASFEHEYQNLALSHAAHLENLAKLDDLAPTLKGFTTETHWYGRVGLRCTSHDRMPLVGEFIDHTRIGSPLPRAGLKKNVLPWQTGLCANLAHGSHGFITAPYCAYLLTQALQLKISETEKNTLAYLNPNRFYLRELGLKRIAKTVALSALSDLHFATDYV